MCVYTTLDTIYSHKKTISEKKRRAHQVEARTRHTLRYNKKRNTKKRRKKKKEKKKEEETKTREKTAIKMINNCG